MKMLKRTLAMFMVLCMMFSIVPMTVFADDTAGTAVTASAEADDFIRVFHLDCGRKYFTVEQVKELIDAISAAYYTHMELAIGNDGLRLLLDDMSVTANGTTYASDTVKSGIQSGNAAYSHSGEWTQAEMDEIISYADSKNIEIIPLVNTPGHMNTILDTLSSLVNTDLSYNNDPRTIDITNETAVTLSQALVAKYIAYFASKGCTYFHMGADEYANTTYYSGSMGFGHLQSENQYDAFVSYVNEVAKLITDAGMIPVAFNDGIYYNNVTNKGTFDPNIVISYWSSGWSNYNVASASTLVSKGHKILNTNDAWYYVLGRSTGNTYSYTTAQNGAQNTAVTKVTGDNSSAVTPIGAMQCVWCDTPSVSYSSTEINRIENLITTLSSNNTNYFVKPEEPEIPVTPEEPENVTLTDNGITVTAPGLTDLTVTEADAPSVYGAAKIKAWNLTPAAAEGNYTGEATVALPIPAEWNSALVRAFVVNADNTIETIIGNVTNGMYEFVMPHFSVGGLYELETAAEDDDISALPSEYRGTVSSSTTTGESYWEIVENGVDGIESEKKYLIANSNSGTVRLLGNDGSKSSSTSVTNGIISTADSKYQFTFEGSGNTWTLKDYNSGYFYITATNYRNNWDYDFGTSSEAVTLAITGNDYIVIRRSITSGGYSTTACLYYYSGYSSNYTVYQNGQSSNAYNHKLYLFEEVSTPGGTVYKVELSGINELLKEIPTAQGLYTDETWNALQSAKTAAETAINGIEVSYEVEADANAQQNAVNTAALNLYNAWQGLQEYPTVEITIHYNTASGENVLTTTKKVPENATSVTLESLITGNDGETYAVNNTTLALESEKFEYSVIVTLDTTPPDDALTGTSLTVEQWITNIHATTTQGGSTSTFTVSSSEAATAEGIEITKYAPENAYWSEGMLYYWQSVRLDADNEQTTGAGDDETADGTTFTHVRYHNSAWQYKDTAGKWNYFLEDDQAVAYYLQKIKLTDEVNTYFKDWGWNLTNEDGYSHVGLSVAVVYPDGTLSGTEDEIYKNATILYNYESGQKNIGLISPENNSIYTIAKITVTPGNYTGSGTINWSEDAGIEWSKKTNEAGSTWYDEKTVWDAVTNAGTTPMVNGSLSSANFPNGIYWDEGGEAWLILIYLDTIHYDTNLMVQWVDDSSAGALISKMEVSVTYEEGEDPITYFNGLKQTSAVPAVDGTLTLDDNAYVVNSSGFNQTFNKDITIIPDVATQYRSGLYQYTGAEIADDGMTLILHYNINMAKLTPLYVIDFGLPVSFPFSDMVKNPEDLTNVVIDSCSYGEVAVDMTKQIITFTPTDILQNIAVVKITVTYENGTTSTFRMGFVPATTVYYDESFLDYDSNWKITTMGSNDDVKTDVGAQAKEAPGQKLYNYGYDPAYADSANGSGNTAASTSTAGATASFTFTGTGFELYGNSNGSTGIVSVLSQANANNTEKVNKIYMIDTKLSTGTTDATSQQSGTYYSLPFISEKALPYGTYTVTIKRSASNETNNPIYIDGVRIINTIKDSSIYVGDLEDNPNFYQIRDMVLSAVGVNGATSEQVYKAITPNNTETVSAEPVAVVMDGNTADSKKVQDLLDNGPKNELYLYPGQTLTFNVETARVMQLGLKAPSGSTRYTINVKTGSDTTGTTTTDTMATSVDMFYKIAEKATASTVYTVTVTNIGSNVLSVTDLKICDDPNAAFVPLTQADIENVLSSIAGVPEEPVITYADAELNVRFVDYTGRVISSGSLTANGVTGTDMTFSASDILGAASMPARYAFVDADSVTDAIVACGESETVTVQIGRVATLRVVYMNLFGRKLDTVVITRVQTKAGYAVIPASEIRSQAPAGARVIWPIPTYVSYGSSVIVTVPVV